MVPFCKRTNGGGGGGGIIVKRIKVYLGKPGEADTNRKSRDPIKLRKKNRRSFKPLEIEHPGGSPGKGNKTGPI